MLSETTEHNNDRLVSVSKETMLEMARRLSGLQNVALVLGEKDVEIKKLRQNIIVLQSKLQELQETVSLSNQQQSVEVSIDMQPRAGIQHRSSAPEIFLYPDISKSRANIFESLKERGSSVKVRDSVNKTDFGDNVKIDSETKFFRLQHDASNADESNLGASNKIPEKNYGMSLNINPMVVQEGSDCAHSVGGVSELYFNNVVSELVKTKQYLYNLQKQLKEKVAPPETSETEDALRLELRELRQQHEQTQGENELLKLQNERLRKTEKRDLNDSFEIEQKQTAEKQTETDGNKNFQVTSPEVQKLKSEIVRLTREKNELLKEKPSNPADILFLRIDNDSLRKQLDQKTVLYNQQKESNKVLNACLHEEKERYKQLEDKYRDRMKENKALSDRLAHIRQEHEELMREKNALEKTLSLSDWNPAHSYSSEASDYSRRGHIRQPSDNSVHSSGSDYAIAPARIQKETGSYQELECPNCQQTYMIEKEYIIHIAKCCVD